VFYHNGVKLGLARNFMNNIRDKAQEKRSREQETAQYIADMLLELRNIARLAALTTLFGLLELSFCEAFSIANKVKIPDGEIEKLRQLVRAASEE
jgi:hypothetical protein